MRGTLTNGYEWLFVVLTVNLTGGASYVVSIREHSVAPQDVGGKMVLNEDQADMIAGILASWVCHRILRMCSGILTLLDPTLA
jgi:hypothetical protein